MIQNSEINAKKIVETLCPNPHLRTIYMSIISDGIIEANKYDRKIWTVNMSNDAIRLTVAHYYVCTINKDGIWLALDNAFQINNSQGQNYLPTTSDLNTWGWEIDDPAIQKGAYPNYKDRSKHTDFSANGYYSIGENHLEAWKHIRKLFLSLIYKAIYYGQDMDKLSPTTHASGFLKYARNQFGIALPDPLYDAQE